MKLREGIGLSEEGPLGSKIAPVLVLASMLLLSFPAAEAGAENTLLSSTKGPSFLAVGELSGYGIGATRTREGGYGLGFSLSKSLVPAPENWDYRPFLVGLASPREEPGLEWITTGIAASYFDYRIGGWALSSDSIAWIRGSNYRLSSTGSFTVGNIGLSYDIGLSGPGDAGNFWFPLKEGTEFTDLYRESSRSVANTRGNYLLFGGSKGLSLGKERLTWSQGVSLDLREENPGLELVTDLNYMGNSVSFSLGDLSLERWSIQLKLNKFVLGYISSGSYVSRRAVSLGYRGEVGIDFELVTSTAGKDRFFNLTARW